MYGGPPGGGFPPPGYGVPGGPPLPKSSNAPLITAISLGVVLMLGLATLVWFVVNRQNAATPVADASSEPSASASASPSPSPSPSASPSGTPPDERLSYTDYDEDWNFRLGGVQMSANYVDGWDHDTCEEFDANGTLTDLGCEYGVELAYEAEKGKLRFAHLILAMPDTDAAREAAEDGAMDDDDFSLNSKGYFSSFKYGKWASGNGGAFTVITVCTAKKSVGKKKADDYLHYAHTDMTGALTFR